MANSSKMRFILGFGQKIEEINDIHSTAYLFFS